MSLSYSEYPVYIGRTALTEQQSYVPATQASVNYNTNHSPQRKLGSAIATGNEFGYAGGLTADISIDCLFQSGMVSGLEQFLLDANQESAVTIQLGNNRYNKCYATEASVNISPFAPVTLQAKFTCLEPTTGGGISGDPSIYAGGAIPLDTNKVAYGHKCSITDGSSVLNNTNSQITFSRSYSRSPVYPLGSVNATEMLLDGVEEQITISSTGVNKLIDYSGEVLNDTLRVKFVGVGVSDPYVTDLIKFTKGSRVLTQSYSNQGGETLTTTSTIKQIKL